MMMPGEEKTKLKNKKAKERRKQARKTGRELNPSLHDAAASGDVGLLRFLLKNGADVAAENKMCRTPLHIAATMGHVEVMEVLLARGAPVGAVAKNGEQPLHGAARHGRVDAIRVLISHGADVTAKTCWGLRPIDQARGKALQAGTLRERNVYDDVVKLLEEENKWPPGRKRAGKRNVGADHGDRWALSWAEAIMGG